MQRKEDDHPTAYEPDFPEEPREIDHYYIGKFGSFVTALAWST